MAGNVRQEVAETKRFGSVNVFFLAIDMNLAVTRVFILMNLAGDTIDLHRRTLRLCPCRKCTRRRHTESSTRTLTTGAHWKTGSQRQRRSLFATCLTKYEKGLYQTFPVICQTRRSMCGSWPRRMFRAGGCYGGFRLSPWGNLGPPGGLESCALNWRTPPIQGTTSPRTCSLY